MNPGGFSAGIFFCGCEWGIGLGEGRYGVKISGDVNYWHEVSENCAGNFC